MYHGYTLYYWYAGSVVNGTRSALHLKSTLRTKVGHFPPPTGYRLIIQMIQFGTSSLDSR